MRNYPFSLHCLWSILPQSKYYIPAYRICQRAHRLSRLRRSLITMQPDLTKIMPKTWLHDRSCRCVERLSSTTVEHSLYNGRNLGRLSCCMCSWLAGLFAHQGVFCLIHFIRYREFSIRHTHHLLGYLICFLLVNISWLVDLEFRLKHW